jgi:Flp pilus assembly pilin Flp
MRRGQGVVEYLLVIGLIVVVIVAIVVALSSQIKSMLHSRTKPSTEQVQTK